MSPLDPELFVSLHSVGLIQLIVVAPREADGFEVLAEADLGRAAQTFPCMVVQNLSKVAEIGIALYSAGDIDGAQAQAYAATEDCSLQIVVYRLGHHPGSD